MSDRTHPFRVPTAPSGSSSGQRRTAHAGTHPGHASWLKRGLRRAGYGVTAALLLGGGALGWMASVNPFGERDSITLLALGADQGMNGRARSDTLILGKVALTPRFGVRTVAVPRDTRVTVPGHGRCKVNAAMAYGGVPLTRRTLQRNFGITPDRYLLVTPTAMARLVDALGGVTLDVPRRMQYRDRAQNLNIDLHPGRQRLNGAQSVQFLRWRSDGLGDLGRVTRQRAFLQSLAQELRQPSCWPRLPGAALTLRRELKTDLTPRELVYLGVNALRTRGNLVEPRKVRLRLDGRGGVLIRKNALRTVLNRA